MFRDTVEDEIMTDPLLTETSPELNLEITSKLAVLEMLSSEINKLEGKLARFPVKKSSVLQQIVANKWVYGCFSKDLRSYDQSFAKRTRTFVGLCGEELMKLLLKLDQVQSDGIEEVRSHRRKLVTKINNELLPIADKYLVEAQAVVTLNNNIRRLIKQQKETNMEHEDLKEYVLPEKHRVSEASQSTEEPLEKAAMETETPHEQTAESTPLARESEQTQDSDAESEAMADSGQKEPSKETEESALRLSPEYRIRQTDEAAFIKLLLPSNEAAEDLRFQLKGYNDELVVHGNNFELPFRVNSSTYALDEAQVRVITDEEVTIIIPRRQYTPPDYYQSSYDPFSGYAPGYQSRERPRHRSGNRQQQVPYHGYSPFFDNTFFGRSYF